MTSAVQRALARVVEGGLLTEAEVTEALSAILEGGAGAAETAGLAVALRMRGETRLELATAARLLRERMAPVPFDPAIPVLDTCGTGGDGSGTFNISTVAALLVAACGVPVAKHGNRAVSSRAGSADLLEALGIDVDPGPEVAAAQLAELKITFLYAPRYHATLRHAAAVRRELGVRTLFNLLGPLANPARAAFQLLGVYDPARVRGLCEVLLDLGVERAWVVHGTAPGTAGLDEISIAGPTLVATLERGVVHERTVTPETFGLPRAPLSSLRGDTAEANASIARSILEGDRGAPRDAVVLNAAAALLVSGAATEPEQARKTVESAIDSGAARDLLSRWRTWKRS